MKVQFKNVIFLFCVLAIFPLFAVYAQDSVKTQNKGQKTKLQVQHGPRFVDKDGDGFNDNAPDHDGDGIPNGLDPDYKGKGKKKRFIDLDGDGINDNVVEEGTQNKQKGFGPKGKSAKQGMTPQDGTGQQKGKGKGKKGRK